MPAGTRKARPPRGARRGTGGCHREVSMDTSTHAFADTREVTTYTMLQRVLQNHCTTHVMSLLTALTSAVLLLAGTCVQRIGNFIFRIPAVPVV